MQGLFQMEGEKGFPCPGLSQPCVTGQQGGCTFKASLFLATFLLQILLSPAVHWEARQWFGSCHVTWIARLVSMRSLQGVGQDALPPAQLFLLERK